MTNVRVQEDPWELTEFARLDPALLGLNLFRPLPKRDRTKARLKSFDMKTEYDGRSLRIAGPYTLGSDDLAILFAVLALAGLLGKPIEAANSEASRTAIIDGLESKGEVVNAVHFRVRTTFYAICREAGLEVSGQTYERITESLWRMSSIIYADLGPIKANARRMYASGSQRLLSFSADEATREAAIVINARFTMVVLGQLYSRVDLKESRALGEMARLVHFALCMMIRPGRMLRIETDKLVERIYGAPPSSPTQARERRKELRHGLQVLGGLPAWSVSENRRTGVTVVERAATHKSNSPGVIVNAEEHHFRSAVASCV